MQASDTNTPGLLIIDAQSSSLGTAKAIVLDSLTTFSRLFRQFEWDGCFCGPFQKPTHWWVRSVKVMDAQPSLRGRLSRGGYEGKQTAFSAVNRAMNSLYCEIEEEGLVQNPPVFLMPQCQPAHGFVVLATLNVKSLGNLPDFEPVRYRIQAKPWRHLQDVIAYADETPLAAGHWLPVSLDLANARFSGALHLQENVEPDLFVAHLYLTGDTSDFDEKILHSGQELFRNCIWPKTLRVDEEEHHQFTRGIGFVTDVRGKVW